jgi:putative flippase GtrA
MTLALKYAFFALVATLTNIGTQYVAFSLYSGEFSLYAAICLGTFTGLIVKYVLDKKFIFFVKANSLSEDTGKFILYSLMGVVTTLIFWGSEILFNGLFEADNAKYVGAAVGLTVGYIIKYQLDKAFVFNTTKRAD